MNATVKCNVVSCNVDIISKNIKNFHIKGKEMETSVELFTVNNLWMMVCTALVFVMHLGFSVLEAGLTRAKNTINILYKNVFIICFGILSYGFIGFALMYPGEFNGFLGVGNLFLSDGNNATNLTGVYNPGYTFWTDFLFQGMFAATAATIVSGAVAERINLKAFILFTIPFVAFVYPVLGSWKWGGGWLDNLGFYDFAGSTLVHSVGGWAALIGAIKLGPRLGKYSSDNKISPIPGHSLPLATIGTFVLWLGWFGFNGGSVLSANPGMTSLVLMTTTISAAAGGIAAMIYTWFKTGIPDLSMTLNGILGGLVGITAGADQMSFFDSVVIGACSGIIVVFFVMFFDRKVIDDPVGAISVHLMCGIWGTLAVGLLGQKAGLEQLGIQTIGVFVYGLASSFCAYVLFAMVNIFIKLRVSKEEEVNGLDLTEHASEAYNL